MALNFPSSPADGDVYDNFVWDAAAAVWRPNRGTLASLKDVSITSPANGDYLYYNGTTWVNGNGYRLKDVLVYTADSTFTKASYPWLRAMTIKMQGAGGGGGGAATTTATQTAVGGAGGAGAYAEFFLTDLSGLASSATVTIGAAGAAGTAGANAGGNGSSTTFDTYTVGAGTGGAAGTAAATNRVIAGAAGSSTFTNIPAGAITVDGSSGQSVWSLGATTPGSVMRGFGGRSFLSPGGTAGTTTTTGSGTTAAGHGGGGSGGYNALSQATARTGGAGSAGLIILELWA